MHTNDVPECEVFQQDPEAVDAVVAGLAEPEELQDVADLFKVLGDPTRVKILQALWQHELCVCDLSGVLDMSVSAVSHQLRLLRAARLVAFRKDGKMVFYQLKDQHVQRLFEQALEHVRE